MAGRQQQLGSASVDARTGPSAADPGGEKLQIR